MEEIGKPLVYIPSDAKINTTNKPMEDIKTKYEKNRVVLDREKVKEVVKGIYGSPAKPSAKFQP